MSASVIAYWPGITYKQIGSQPGFYNDYDAWANWVVEMTAEPAATGALKALGAGALLTHITEGMDDADVVWVTPWELREAARRLKDELLQHTLGADQVFAIYWRNANGVLPIREEFVRDLQDIESLTKWAEEQGARKMTLEINW